MSRRHGVATGDVLMGLSGLILLLALLYPAIRSRDFRLLVDASTTDVEALRRSAAGSFDDTGSWPAPGPARAEEQYSIEWRILEFVEQVPALANTVAVPADADRAPDSVGPPLRDSIIRVGSIVVHSGVDELLASLLERYGRESSFVRDSSWTLVLRPGAGN